MKKITALSLVCFLGSCATSPFATHPLTPEGAQVMVTDVITLSEFEHYTLVGKPTGVAYNLELARNEVRNNAAKLGATVIRILSVSKNQCDLVGAAIGKEDTANCYYVEAEAFAPKIVAPVKTR